MSALADRTGASRSEWLALAAVLALGCGTVLALAGVGARNTALVLGAGAVAGAALTAMMAAGWVNGVVVVLLALPLPALYRQPGLRISAAAPLTAALVLAWAVDWSALGRRIRTGALPVRAMAALVATYLVASLFADARLLALRELINFGVLVAFLVVLTDTLGREPAARHRLVPALVAIGAASGGLALLETVGVLPGQFPRWGSGLNRAALGLGQPNGLGLFLALLLPFAVHTAVTGRTAVARLAGLSGAGLMMLGLFGTFSRGAWLSALAGLLPLLLTGERRFALRMLGWAVLAMVLLDLGSGGLIGDTAVRTVTDWSVEQRGFLMLAGVLMFRANPILGVGPGGYAVEVERFATLIPDLWDIEATPHNAYIQMAAETGAIGLVAFVAFLSVTLLILMRRVPDPEADVEARERSLRRTLVWAFAVACAAGMVTWPLVHGPGQVVMLIAAMGLAGPVGSRPT